MKALVYEGNHRLTIQEKEIPTIGKDEVLIRVSYTGICGTDIHIWHGGYGRLVPPITIGHEFSGVIEKIGNSESPFQVGDRVTVEPIYGCGKCEVCQNGDYNLCKEFNLIGVDADGSMAEYIKVPEDKVFRIKSTMGSKDAAFVEPLAVGVHAVKKSGLKAKQNALIIGGGPIGLITAYVARLQGANVYISEINNFRKQQAEELGFSVIDPQQEDIKNKIELVTNGFGVDVSFEVTGTNPGLNDTLLLTSTKGTVVIIGLPNKLFTIDTYTVIAKELNIVGSRVYTKGDFERAIHLIETGQFKTSDLISHVTSLDDAIEEGFKRIDQGDDVMKVMIQIGEGGEC